MQMRDKRVVVTGGSRGIGAEIVSALVREGARVASLDVLDDLGNKVAEAANEAGPGRATYLHCDISSRTGVDTAFERGARAMGGIDGLVNAAGIESHIDPQDITDDDWDVIMAIKDTGEFLTNTNRKGVGGGKRGRRPGEHGGEE